MIKRFKYAVHGLLLGLKTDRSIRLHWLVAALVFLAGIILRLPPLQWAILIITIFFVIIMEYINSAIESFADRVHPEQHFAIKKTKDLAAAGVLLAAICAFFVGLLIFLPPLLSISGKYCATVFSTDVR